ncbi:MAG: chromosome segregation protein SMC [Methanolinea sp.]|nr:chromosome segregation protein SMC [Methanolinea sp.]
MHITELEIDNFKSFTKKTKIPFYEGFSVISGPNGSGKSNIIDSILFVLAISSSRTLRAEKLTDLINLNSGKHTAEVTLAFSDGTKIRRRIKRTSSGYYSYIYLNNRLSRQAEVNEHLAKHGIKPHGYNVVMQGDITRIIEMSDFERRKIIDEIAGVAEFDQKKDQALTELEVVRERIEREELLLRELSQRLDELSMEREQALKFRHWQENLQRLEGLRAAATLRTRERDASALSRLIEDERIQLDRVLSDRSLEENEREYLKSDLQDIDTQINQKSGAEYLRLIAELEEAKGTIRLAEQTISRLKKEKEASLEGINRTYIDHKRAETRIGECSQAIREMNIDRTNLAMETATVTAQREKIEQQIQYQSRDAEGAKDELFALMQTIEEKKNERSSLLHQKDMILEKSRMRTSERERMEERLQALSDEGTGKEQKLSESAREMEALAKEKSDLDRALSELESSVFARRTTLERVKEEFRTHEQEAIRLEAQQQARGEAGSRVLEAVLGMDGVFGTIAQLGKAPPEYATALNVAAGQRLHYVVVKDDAVAARAIEYLKEQKMGRVTFLPLSRMRPPDLPPVKDEGVIGYAVQMLEFQPQYADAFRVVFGGTVVVESMSGGRRLLGKYRMVTPEGELLEKSGAMTGGSFKKPLRGFGAAVEDEISRIRSKMEELAADIADIERSVKRGGEEIDAKRARRAELDAGISRLSILRDEFSRQEEVTLREKTQINEVLEALAEEVRSGTSELAAFEAGLDSITDAITLTGKKIEQVKKKLEDTSIPVLSEQLEKKKRECEDIERRLRNKEADINDLQRERQHFTSRLEELKAEVERIQAKNADIDREVSLSLEQIEASRTRINEIEERQKQFSTELLELRNRHTQISDTIRESEQKILEFDAASERYKIQLSVLNERFATLSEEIEVLRREVGETDTDLTLQEIEDGMAEASREIKKLGAVNMLAIEEYERVQGRITERGEKKEVLSRERATLLERIEKFEKMKYEAFMTAFKAIDANFREVFARLTSGNGHLILENEDDPFSGGLSFAVQPRDKPVHLLSALSGGEKSLTTLAFIFSIQQYIPAPFYAFDEVDMSLDGSNVERIAAMIRELSTTSQFILVSLRKPMIEGADRILGVTLLPDKSSFVTGIKSHG